MTASAGVIDLSSGQVVRTLPDPVRRALDRALPDESVTAYAPMAGRADLRAAVAAHYRDRRVGRSLDADLITVTAGARHGLFSAVAAVAAGGDVLVPRPYWSHYPSLIGLAGARPVYVDGDPDDHLLVDPDRLEDARTPATRAVLVNSPVNPTGGSYGGRAVTAIRAWAAGSGVRLLVDDVYWAYGANTTAVHEEDVVVGGAAKVHAAAGLRIGWVSADARTTTAVRRVVEHTTGPVDVLAQIAVAALLEHDDVPARVRVIAGQRHHAVTAMSGIPGVRVLRPDGGIYVCLDVSGLLGDQWPDDAALCRALDEQAGVRLRAGSTFGLPGHLRLCVAAPAGLVSEAATRLRAHLAEHGIPFHRSARGT